MRFVEVYLAPARRGLGGRLDNIVESHVSYIRLAMVGGDGWRWLGGVMDLEVIRIIHR